MTNPSTVHVYPIREREHDTEHGSDCWCAPEVEDYRAMGGGLLIIHRDRTTGPWAAVCSSYTAT